MIELIEKVMKFIYTHPFFRKVCHFLFLSTLLLFGFVSFLFFSNGLNFSNIFQVEAYYFLMQKYKTTIITFFIIEQIALVYLILWQDKKLRDINKSPKEQIHIKDIAEIWTQYNAPNTNEQLMVKTTFNERQNIASINETLISVAHYNYAETQIFMNEIVKPIAKRISSGHLKTIIRLLNLLEQNKHCPSVVNFAKTEPNIIYKDREYVSIDKKTKYDIYEEISVYRHSLNVAKNAVEILQQQNKGSKMSLIGKVIIVALAHDIGKIERYEIREQKIAISFEDRKKIPHQNLSSMILYDGFKDCPDLQEIAEVVQRHHNLAFDKGDTLLKILIEADSATRNDEIHKYKLGEDICDLLGNDEKQSPKKELQISKKTTQSPTTQPKQEQPQSQPQEYTLFDNSFDDLKQRNPHEIVGLVLINVKFDKDLAQDDYKVLDTLLKKELDSVENTCYANDKGFYVAQLETDRVKVLNFAYDLSQRIAKSEFKKCHIGFVMAKEAQDGKDMAEKVNLAIDEAIKTNAIIDFKNIKAHNDDEKVLVSDTPQESKVEKEVQKQEIKATSTKKDEIISPQIPQNKTKTPKVIEKSDEISQDDLMSEDIDGAIDEKDDDVFNQMKKLAQQIKVVNPANEESFDIVRLENQIFKELASKINTFSSEGGFYINSVSFKKFVLFSKRCLIDTLAKILQNDENIEKKVNFFIRYYRNHENENKRYIWFVGVEKGYYESMYYIGQNENDFVKTSFVPFEAKLTFNLDVYQLEKMKNSSELANYKIGEFSKERKR